MKLTVKVEKRDKVRAFVRDFEDYGCINRPFDTEDFVELENAVILTVEEAKEAIGDYVGVVAEVIRQCQQGVSEVKIKHPNSIVRLMEKIKQAEIP